MADTKISALTAATTPLAGTEVLPIVQSGVTKQVSVANLTAGRAVSGLTFQSTVATGTAPFTVASTTNVANLNASSLNGATFAAPGAIGSTTESTGKFTTVQATASTAFKTNSTSGQYYHFDAATGNNFVGLESANNIGWYVGGYKGLGIASSGTTVDVTFSTGNVVQGTAAKGINFTANTGAAGKTSQLLNWYEEGTWTPGINALTGAFTTTVLQSATYTRIGRMVSVQVKWYPSSIGTGSDGFQLTNLPYTASPTNAFPIAGKNISTDSNYNGYIEISGTTMRFSTAMVQNHTYIINGTYFV
jgi:hypothetical protein